MFSWEEPLICDIWRRAGRALGVCDDGAEPERVSLLRHVYKLESLTAAAGRLLPVCSLMAAHGFSSHRQENNQKNWEATKLTAQPARWIDKNMLIER